MLNFIEFMTEECCDFLTIYEGKNMDDKQLYELSGTSIPSKKMITAKSVFIDFTSDSSGSDKGFKILVSTSGKSMKLVMCLCKLYILLVSALYLYLYFLLL